MTQPEDARSRLWRGISARPKAVAAAYQRAWPSGDRRRGLPSGVSSRLAGPV